MKQVLNHAKELIDNEEQDPDFSNPDAYNPDQDGQDPDSLVDDFEINRHDNDDDDY
jgi:hypothetical protein